MAIEVCQVLLVDDDEDDYIVTRDLLNEAEQRIFKLTWVESYEAGLATIHQDRHDVYLLDFRLGQRNGLELLQASRQQGCNKPIILLTAVGDHDIDQQAMTSGACDYLVKGSTLNATLLERSILHAMERKRYEAQLHSLSERLQLAARSANIGIWDWDIVSDCLTWDDRMYELYGVHAFDFSGKLQAWQQRLHGDDAVQAIERLQQAIGGERDFDSVVFRIVHPDGSIRWIEAHALVQCDADGTPQRMIGVNADISDRKTAEVKLQLTNAELARATRLKDEFLANMSHELRTPLNAILGMTEALQEHTYGKINILQQRALQTVERSSAHLLELINEILDLAKIEAGQMELNCNPTNINELCKASLLFIKQQAFRKRIQAQVKIPAFLSTLMIDERRIRQVLINLLNNAVKFTPEHGEITLQVTLETDANASTWPDPEDSNGAWVRFTVIDTGIGIGQDKLATLFQPFVQIDSALNRQYTGTGLGLFLVKRIVEMHSGKLGVISQEGIGSQFWFALPCKESQSQLPVTDLMASSTTLSQTTLPFTGRVLLAEDNVANVQTISNYLKIKGYTILLASNGQEAIDMAISQQPDIILMDIQMPKVDGLEAIKRIREYPNLQEIPIIALTALAMEGDRDKCLAAGATDYLSKPIRLKELITTIQKLLT